jgi:hypothetical protein
VFNHECHKNKKEERKGKTLRNCHIPEDPKKVRDRK